MKSLALLLLLLLTVCLPIVGAQWETPENGYNWVIGPNWELMQDWEVNPTPTPTASPEPSVLGNSRISLTEIILIVIWVIFLLLSWLTKEPFLFGISAFVSIILGLDLALIYLGDGSEWIFGIVGFAIVMFGIFQMIVALTVKSKGDKQR